MGIKKENRPDGLQDMIIEDPRINPKFMERVQAIHAGGKTYSEDWFYQDLLAMWGVVDSCGDAEPEAVGIQYKDLIRDGETPEQFLIKLALTELAKRTEASYVAFKINPEYAKGGIGAVGLVQPLVELCKCDPDNPDKYDPPAPELADQIHAILNQRNQTNLGRAQWFKHYQNLPLGSIVLNGEEDSNGHETVIEDGGEEVMDLLNEYVRLNLDGDFARFCLSVPGTGTETVPLEPLAEIVLAGMSTEKTPYFRGYQDIWSRAADTAIKNILGLKGSSLQLDEQQLSVGKYNPMDHTDATQMVDKEAEDAARLRAQNPDFDPPGRGFQVNSYMHRNLRKVGDVLGDLVGRLGVFYGVGKPSMVYVPNKKLTGEALKESEKKAEDALEISRLAGGIAIAMTDKLSNGKGMLEKYITELAQRKGIRDIDMTAQYNGTDIGKFTWEEYAEAMQFCAIYSLAAPFITGDEGFTYTDKGDVDITKSSTKMATLLDPVGGIFKDIDSKYKRIGNLIVAMMSEMDNQVQPYVTPTGNFSVFDFVNNTTEAILHAVNYMRPSYLIDSNLSGQDDFSKATHPHTTEEGIMYVMQHYKDYAGLFRKTLVTPMDQRPAPKAD